MSLGPLVIEYIVSVALACMRQNHSNSTNTAFQGRFGVYRPRRPRFARQRGVAHFRTPFFRSEDLGKTLEREGCLVGPTARIIHPHSVNMKSVV
jgi:hypothetical protein